MKNVGIIVKKGIPAGIEVLKNLLEWFGRRKIRAFVEKEIASIIKIRGYSKEYVLSKADVIIVLGGDGTLLGAARLVGKKEIPILGINLGTLGFITAASLDEINEEIIARVFSGKCHVEERIMLCADIYRNGRKIAEQTALNDVVINKSALARMVELDIHINKQHVTEFRADGLIVSTPTGSTAHSLSAGGPILYPTLESYVVTPICPHTLSNRPLVLPGKFILEVSIKRGNDVYVTFDGQVGFPLKSNDKVIVRRADFKTRLILIHRMNYFHVLRTKLKWGDGQEFSG